MRMEISYCEGYGWHCGRLIMWPALLLLGVISAFVAVFLEVVLRKVTHLPLPFALAVPFLFLYILRLRLVRRLNGKPFAIALPRFFMDDMTTLLVPRGHRHFRALCMVEIFIWGSVVACQLGILAVFYQKLWR